MKASPVENFCETLDASQRPIKLTRHLLKANRKKQPDVIKKMERFISEADGTN